MENIWASNEWLFVPCYKTIRRFKLYADRSVVVFNCYTLMCHAKSKPKPKPKNKRTSQKWNCFTADGLCVRICVRACFFSSCFFFSYFSFIRTFQSMFARRQDFWDARLIAMHVTFQNILLNVLRFITNNNSNKKAWISKQK